MNLKSYCFGNLKISQSSTIFLAYVLLSLLQVGIRLLWQLSCSVAAEPCLLTLCSQIAILLEGSVTYIAFQSLKRVHFDSEVKLSSCLYLNLLKDLKKSPEPAAVIRF